MPDALINPVRTCRYEHGPLRKESGNWIVQGVGFTEKKTPLLDGRGFVFTIYTCSTCGYTEFVDESL